jgi:hypothetical protein
LLGQASAEATPDGEGQPSAEVANQAYNEVMAAIRPAEVPMAVDFEAAEIAEGTNDFMSDEGPGALIPKGEEQSSTNAELKEEPSAHGEGQPSAKQSRTRKATDQVYPCFVFEFDLQKPMIPCPACADIIFLRFCRCPECQATLFAELST